MNLNTMKMNIWIWNLNHIKIDEMRDKAIERMSKICVMLRGEDGSQPSDGAINSYWEQSL